MFFNRLRKQTNLTYYLKVSIVVLLTYFVIYKCCHMDKTFKKEIYPPITYRECSGDEIMEPVRRNQTSDSVWKTKECKVYWEEQFRSFQLCKAVAGTAQHLEQPQLLAMVTQLSSNRLPSLQRLCQKWAGPLTAVVYTEGEDINSTASYLRKLKAPCTLVAHLVITNGTLYPVNTLRNVAQQYTNAEHIFMVDVDFVPSLHLYEEITKTIKEGFFNRKRVLIIPSLSVLSEIDVPQTKSQVMEGFHTKIKPFDFGNPNFKSDPINFDRWLRTNESYKLQPRHMYEPYFVIPRASSPEFLPWFQPRWRDKVSHVETVLARCFEMWVFPDGFIVHVSHETALSTYISSLLKCAISIYETDFQNYLEKESAQFCKKTV